MAKNKKLNPLDQSIQKWIPVFTNIDGFQNIVKDQDLINALIFISTQLENLNKSRQLVANSFVPAVNKLISDTKGYITTSIYKEQIKLSGYSLESILEDTIRLGYVMFFHKYENFINEYISWVDKRSEGDDEKPDKTVLEECKIRFDFDPRNWWKFPAVHKVNFISNCTKHHNGKCKVNKPKDKKPQKYANTSDDEYIKPSLQDFNNDTLKLIDSVANYLIPIIGNVVMLRGSESMVKLYENLILTNETGAVLYENSHNETFAHEGIHYPLYEGDALQKQYDIGKVHRNKIHQLKLEMQVYKDRSASSIDLITSKIKLYQADEIL